MITKIQVELNGIIKYIYELVMAKKEGGFFREVPSFGGIFKFLLTTVACAAIGSGLTHGSVFHGVGGLAGTAAGAYYGAGGGRKK